MTKTPGRPSGDARDSDTRQRLIREARSLFIDLPYHQVSVRQIARNAGVDAALVRYYFGNKGQLFEAVLRETIEPMVTAFQAALANRRPETLDAMTHIYYRTIISQAPGMPRMVMRILGNPADSEPFNIMYQTFSRVIELTRVWIQNGLGDAGLLRDGLDPELARLSFVSLTLFPLIAPPVLMQKFGFSPTTEHLERLANHNSEVLTGGILKRPNGDSHE
ncbi:TetR/AcrR family transcriptional regulator [Thalassolituus sp. LLYu03]|uniref:TetR/AcrR family transcriptional regulator n=1 Tax=Thalassolituus sp. LLYu03 TaxID=3421656 RepID=UPI003D2CF148